MSRAMCPLAGWASSGGYGRVPDAVRRYPGDAKHRPVALLRRAGTHTSIAQAGPGSEAHRLRAAQRPGRGSTQAMNMRAAEAIVSSAPKLMKIFPIREVWSQVELSVLLAAVTGVAGAAGASAAAIARVGAGRAVSCSARSTSLS